MDTSKKYILMCEKAVELQKDAKNHKWETKSTFARPEDYQIIDSIHIANYDEIKPFIWLPRQDQLQGMVKSLFSSQWIMNKNFYAFSIYDSKYEYWSMEQLWLAFVMKEKFNKTWDGENWEGLNKIIEEKE